MLKLSIAFLMILALAVAKQELDEIVDDASSAVSGCSESPYISKIPSDGAAPNPEPLSLEELSTYVQQLNDAGVRTNGNLKTLSYTEISRLLALWQLSHQRNYYDMNKKDKEEGKEHKTDANNAAVAPPQSPSSSAIPHKPKSATAIDNNNDNEKEVNIAATAIDDDIIIEDQHKKRVTRV